VKDKGLTYFETSAKSGLNVKDMFIGVASLLTEKSPTTENSQSKKKGTTL